MLSALTSSCEYLLPSIVNILNNWFTTRRDKSSDTDINQLKSSCIRQNRQISRELIYCITLTNILKMLPFHPSLDISSIEEHAYFWILKHKTVSRNGANTTELSELYSKLIGLIAEHRFFRIGKRFIIELEGCLKDDITSAAISKICAILKGMRFIRIKVAPIEELEVYFSFLNDVATLLTDVKDKDVKHGVAQFYVHLLTPFVNVTRSEVNIPCVRNFVSFMYGPSFEMCIKGKDKHIYYPLITCLLCMKRKTFFLNNWHKLLTLCLPNLKNSDTKIALTCLECVCRLVWFVCVRLNCVNSSNVLQHLNCIVNSILPRGSKIIVPKDCDMSLFVQIIYFLSQGQRDIVLGEVVGDLLSFGRLRNTIYPERTTIGIYSYLLIYLTSIDSSLCNEITPSSSIDMEALLNQNIPKCFLNEQCYSFPFYSDYVRSFENIIRNLDSSCGRSLLLTRPDRESEDTFSVEIKSRLKLLKICVPLISLFISDYSSLDDVLELLLRLTIHQNNEISTMSYSCLQRIIDQHPNIAPNMFECYSTFIVREISDQLKFQKEPMSKLHLTTGESLYDLIQAWYTTLSKLLNPSLIKPIVVNSSLEIIDGVVICFLCSTEIDQRVLALKIMKFCQTIFKLVRDSYNSHHNSNDSLNSYSPLYEILNERLTQLYLPENKTLLSELFPSNAPSTALLNLETIFHQKQINATNADDFNYDDPYGNILRYLFSYEITRTMPLIQKQAWSLIYTRCSQILPYVESSVTNETRSSLFRNVDYLKRAAERESNHQLFGNYLIMACCFAPSASSASLLNSNLAKEYKFQSSSTSFQTLLKIILPLLRGETMQTQRILYSGLSSTNPEAFGDLIVELSPYVREASDNKQERFRRSKKKDYVRLTILRIFERASTLNTFKQRFKFGFQSLQIITLLHEYFRTMTQYFEQEAEKDSEIVQQTRITFCKLVYFFVFQIPIKNRSSLITRDIRYNLFYFFDNWSGHISIFRQDNSHTNQLVQTTMLNTWAFRASSAILCAGPIDTEKWIITSENPIENSNSFATRSSQLVSAVYRAPGRIIMHVAPGIKKPRQIISNQNVYNQQEQIFLWLERLVCTANEDDTVIQTLTDLLLLNGDQMDMIECVINMFYCISKNNDVTHRCFFALTNVFLYNNSEYPCDIPSLLTVSLTCLSNPVIYERALKLTQALSQDHLRFSLLSVSPSINKPRTTSSSSKHDAHDFFIDLYLNSDLTCYDSQKIIVKLATSCPEMTLPIFSEICERSINAVHYLRARLLKVLVPWMNNIQFDNGILIETCYSNAHSLSSNSNLSRSATDLCLNNLLYITTLFGEENSDDLEYLWVSLLHDHQQNNFDVIMNFLYIIISLTKKRLFKSVTWIIAYFTRSAFGRKLFSALLKDLQDHSYLCHTYTVCEIQPFYALKVPPGGAMDESSRFVIILNLFF
ncbi:hypothetical protein GJ496_009506 [Pomphorhynchus laevis]|nr:hypothetical protein GJ496_009506 [Pomphorhynchus laevis]